MTTLYGIPNCDTVKKARKWLDTEGVDYRFHDFRSDGVNAAQLEQWLAEVGVKILVNKRSTSWKKLDDKTRALFDENNFDSQRVVNTLCEMPTLIKRPVLEINSSLLVGFDKNSYAGLKKV